MNLSDAYKSVIDLDSAPIVLTDLRHTIVYMNPSAQLRYAKWGGAGLVGQSLLACHNENSCRIIQETVAWFSESQKNNKKFTHYRHGCDVYMVALRNDAGELIGYYEKHESRKREQTK